MLPFGLELLNINERQLNTELQHIVVELKGLLQSPRIKDHLQTIGIQPSSRNNAIYGHKCLEDIKKYTNKLVSVTTSNN